VMLHR